MDIPIPTQEGDIHVPAPLSSSAPGYGGNGQGHTLHHHHGPGGIALNDPLEEDHPHQHQQPQNHHVVVVGYNNNKNNNGSGGGGGMKVAVRYRECQKNHAAAMGGTATDGCGEFMPSGEEGTIEALTCSACSCHRNFHRKEVDGGCTDLALDWYHSPPPHLNRIGRKVIMGHPTHKNMLASHDAALLYPTGTLIASRAPTPHQMILPYSMAGSLPSELDEQDHDDEHHGGVGPVGGPMVTTSARPTQMVPKKRFRTKFTPEQKEKMLSFAEKAGWKIQRQEESVVQQFCQEVGVKRRVLKVWMHNNKHSLAKKNIGSDLGLDPSSTSMDISPDTTTTTNNNNP